jgi:hypothetical protein
VLPGLIYDTYEQLKIDIKNNIPASKMYLMQMTLGVGAQVQKAF